MAPTYQRQYRPVTTQETAAYASLSVGAMRETCAAVNNTKGYVTNHKTHMLSFFPLFYPTIDGTNNGVQMVFAPRYVPDGYDKAVWWLGHQAVGGGTYDYTWTLRCTSRLYNGPDIYDSGFMAGNASSSSIVSTSATHGISHALIDLVRDHRGLCWFVLTGVTASGTGDSKLTSLDIQPVWV